MRLRRVLLLLRRRLFAACAAATLLSPMVAALPPAITASAIISPTPNLTIVSTGAWTDVGRSPDLHLVGEVRNDDGTRAAGSIQVDCRLVDASETTTYRERTVSTDAANSPFLTALTGTGTGQGPGGTATPTELAFDTQPARTTSPTQTVTVTSSGTDPLVVSGVSITGTDAAWMYTIRRNFGRSVTNRKVRTKMIHTFAKSKVREIAPPFQTGEKMEETIRITIITNK